jgi:hypothetical protein
MAGRTSHTSAGRREKPGVEDLVWFREARLHAGETGARERTSPATQSGDSVAGHSVYATQY